MYLRERQLEGDNGQNPLYTVLFFIFGSMIFFFVYSLAHQYRTTEARESAEQLAARRKAEEEAVEAAAMRRKALSEAFVKNSLSQTLEAKDIKWRHDDELDQCCSNDKGLNGTLSSNISVDGEISIEEKNVLSTTIELEGVAEKNCTTNKMEEGKSNGNTAAINEVVASSSKIDPRRNKGTENELNDIEKATEYQFGEVTLKREGRPSTIPITCAICLERYAVNDVVVWSGNRECTHAFHRDCILDYLVHHDQEAAPCPCCRQVFIPME